MSTKTKTIAKSLHTVSVLVSVARIIRLRSATNLTAAEAVGQAVEALGYGDAEDPHNLTETARRQVAAAFGEI